MTTTADGRDLDALEAERARIRDAHLRPAGERPASTARGLHHTALISSDVERTVRFVQDVLGFPLTAGGLDPCLRLSDHAADVLDEALRTGRPDVLARYDGAALRASFRGRLALRRGLAQVRTPAMATAAFALLRTPPGRAAARRVLFGDRSFPDTARVSAAPAVG